MRIADAHCDTLSGMLSNKEGFLKNSLQIDRSKLLRNNYESYLQIFAVFVSPSVSFGIGQKQTEDMISIYQQMVDKGEIESIKCADDLKKSGIKGLLSIEGLYFTENGSNDIETLFEKGVRCISLTWNPDNKFSGGILGKTGEGLTKEGRKLVNRAFELGILVDVSHISDHGFYDIAEIAKSYNLPFAATHSNSRKLCHHMRNLDNDMLRLLADSGGFTGINMYSCFLNDECSADINDVVKHIEYICGITGPSHVGFGSDFDGIDRNRSALEGPWNMSDVLEKLLSMNYKEDDVKKIGSGNIERVLGDILK